MMARHKVLFPVPFHCGSFLFTWQLVLMPVLATFLSYVALFGLHLMCEFFCYFLQLYIAQAAKSPRLAELAKKVVSNSLGLVHFAIGLASSVLKLPN